MTTEEIQRYLRVGSSRSVAVSVGLLEGVPGCVRTVSICAPQRVRVEFETWGYDEAGAYFNAGYPSIEDIVHNLENYLGQPLARWENFTRSNAYPAKPSDEEMEAHRTAFRAAVERAALPLPAGAKFEMNQNYWYSIWGTAAQ